MENYIVINGKKAELTEEQLKQLGVEVNSINPYKRKRNERYYYSNVDCSQLCTVTKDDGDIIDYESYLYGNYCTDKEMAQQDMLHDLLNRKLRQFSNLNGGIELNSYQLNDIWNDDNSAKYFIAKSRREIDFAINYVSTYKRQGAVYFISVDIARRAIEEIIKPFMKEHPEFVW